MTDPLAALSAVDPQIAGASARWIGLLRQQLGFRGAIVSDDLAMLGAAAVGELPERLQAHAQAGCDLLLACDPQAAIVLLGDLNDVPGSRTLKLLKGQLFHNLLDDLPHGQCYTHRHGGKPQALDHILISPALRRGAIAHIPHHYSDAAPSQEPASDHDPVVAELPVLDI